MNPRALLVSVCLLALAAPPARSQCNFWLPGLLENGAAINGANGPVRVVTPWSAGSVLVAAGQFTNIQGTAANNIAVRDPATGVWRALGSGVDDAVTSVTEFNGDLIVGGSFTHAGGLVVNHVARWDGTTWHAMSGTGVDGVDGPVNALTVYNNQLIAAGSFTQAGGPSTFARNIASWDLATGWHALGVGVGCNLNNCGGLVYCLTLWNGNLIVGGSFTYAGNQPANYIAQWNGSSWSALGAGTNFDVTCLQPYNGQLVVGGRFTQAGGQAANRIAAWTGSAWQALGTGMDFDVLGLSVYSSSLIAGGGFGHAGGVTASNIASWNGSSWQALGAGISSPAAGYAMSMIPYGGELVTGGSFAQAGGQTANNIARWNGYAWAPFGGGNANSVFAMANYLGRLVVAGDFHESTNTGYAAHEIAGSNGTSLASYGIGMDATVFSLKSFKYTGATGSYELIAGGAFTHAGGVPANYIARWDQSFFGGINPAWQAMGSGFNSGVYAIERFNNLTYAGGAFTFSTSAVNYIARWNESTKLWEALGTGMNGAVRALKSYGGYLYAGGSFTSANGVSTGGLARWNGTSWTQVGGFFLGTVYALEVYNGVLVIAGSYPGINSSPNLAYYNGTSYGTFSTGGANATIHALGVSGSRLFIGGEFSTAGGVAASRVAYWDGSAWHDAAGGTDDMVLALSPLGTEMNAGGLFTHASGGAVTSRAWARYSNDGIPWFTTQPSSKTVNPGDNVTFTAAASPGYPSVNYLWYSHDTPLADGPTGSGSTMSGTQTASLTITNVTPYDQDRYYLILRDPCGSDTSVSVMLNVNGTAGVSPGPAPGVTAMGAVWPNPSPGVTGIAFSLARDARVQVSVHDLSGRLVREIDLGALTAGLHRSSWDGQGADGRRLHAGLFFVRLEVDGKPVGDRRVSLLR